MTVVVPSTVVTIVVEYVIMVVHAFPLIGVCIAPKVVPGKLS